MAERQNPLEIWGDGTEERDLIYVDDMADACLFFMERQNGYDPVNIALGQTHSVLEIATTLCALEGTAPEWLFVFGKPRMIQRRYVDMKKASEMGWTAKTSLKDGLAKTLQWYKENLLENR